MEEVFIFFSNFKEEVKEAINNNRIPAGYYTSEDKWCGDRWVTHYWYEGKEEVEKGFYFEGCDIGPNTTVHI